MSRYLVTGRATSIGIVLLVATQWLPLDRASGRIDAAEAFRWSASRDDTSYGTRTQGRPLLVIDLAGEVTSDPFTSRMGRLLAATTFGDPRVIAMSRDRFEVVCRQHGPTALVKRHRSKDSKHGIDMGRSDNVIFYFCTPDARVLHMAAGFLPADELLAAASLAERLFRATQLEDEPISKMQVVRAWHLTCADGQHLLRFQRLCAARHGDRESSRGPHGRFIKHVVAMATRVHAEELNIRFSSHWQGAVLEQTIARLGHHGEVATSFPHLVLSELPLVRLDALDHVCFGAVTGQAFLSISSRRKALYRWFVATRRKRQPMIMVVDDEPFAAPPVNELAELLIWKPKSSEVQAQLAHFAAVQVTPGELTALIQDAALAPVTLSPKSKNWLLYGRDGTLVDVVVSEHGTRLLDAMKLAVE